MRDIVATIQSDQYRLITADPEGALVVQGGPGTGKTAVGLHRASWLLYTHRERLRRVLVVGPNPTFMDYVAHVLPTLGEEAVEQRAVTELLDGIEVDARGGDRRRAAQGRSAVARGRGPCGRDRGRAGAARAGSRSSTARMCGCASGTSPRCSTRRWRSATRSDLHASGSGCAALRRFYERYGELFGPRRAAELRRARARARARRLPHALAEPRAAATAAAEARRAAPHVVGRARSGVGGRAGRRRAEAPPARPAASGRRPALERPGRAAARRGAGAARRRAARPTGT